MEAEAEAVEAALKSTASTSLDTTLVIRESDKFIMSHLTSFLHDSSILHLIRSRELYKEILSFDSSLCVNASS